MRTLIKAKHVYAPAVPFADCLLIDKQIISWVGQQDAVANLDLDFDHVLDLSDFFVSPGFVDSHVHLSATGASLSGLDLSTAKSAHEAIDLLRVFIERNSDSFVIGHGWEDTNWPDANLWNYSEVASIVGDRRLYLSRIDVHSALVNVPGHQGIVKQEQHHQVRQYVQENLPNEQRQKHILSALNHAASKGVVCVHENGGPYVSGEADFLDVLSFANRKDLPEIFAYWGTTDLAQVKRLGAFGAAGDLTVDGSIGSKTAWLNQPYENTTENGSTFLTARQIADHLIACTREGIQGGFHAIGDAALDAVVQGINLAVDEVGISQFRFAKHRIEHAEMLKNSHLDFLAKTGVVLSMQPVFDELWGNVEGLYEQRLGKQRAHQMNTFNSICNAGIPLAFSSDSPVTPIDPWRAVKAATDHHTANHRISARAAFNAHTRGGWRACRDENNGVIAVGLPANLAVWEVDDYTIKVPDERVRAWSTDERSGTPPLPDLVSSMPRCVATIRNGQAIYDPEKFWPINV